MGYEKTRTITDLIHGSIEYSSIEAEILRTSIFNRLHRISQSSLVFQTFPSNRTKRFEHSLGVMDLTGRLFYQSVCNTDQEILNKFMSEIKSAILDWRRNVEIEHLKTVMQNNETLQYRNDGIFSICIPSDPLYYRYLPAKIKEEDKVAYFIVFQAIRIAGLLHDIGHMPYSHIMEHAMQRLYKRTIAIPENERTKNQLNFLKALSIYDESAQSGEDSDALHEKIGKICAAKIFECISNAMKKGSSNFFFIASYDFARSILNAKASQNNVYTDLHRIISGIIDTDRLDYCIRDEFCSGTRKELVDYNRLLFNYSICEVEPEKALNSTNPCPGSTRNSFYFCPSAKSVSAIDSLLYQRYDIFSQINYHHRVHKHEVFFEEIIVELGDRELRELDEVKELEPGKLPLKISSIWLLISLLNSNVPPEYFLIQFDDSWLDTLLKCFFFELYPDTPFVWSLENANDPLWNKYDELISSKRHYYSAFKRSEDFRKVDANLFQKVKDENERLEALSPEKRETLINLQTQMAGFKDYNAFLGEKRSLFTTWLINNPNFTIALLSDEKSNFYDRVQELLLEALSSERKVKDVVLRDCTFSLGTAEGKSKLVIAENGAPVPFTSYSTAGQVLKERRSLSTPVHLYYLPIFSSSGGSPVEQTVQPDKDIYPQFVSSIWTAIRESMNLKVKPEEDKK